MESFSALHPLAKKPVAPRGFTLVEMVVVLAIIIVITAVVINGQSTYNQSILLTDTAYTVAFSVRQAQSLGLASRGINSVTDAGYGVRFTGPTATGYTVFADTTGTRPAWITSICPQGQVTEETRHGNCLYDATDPIVQSYTFGRGFTISNICGKTTGILACGLSSLTIVYMRPETRAIITDPSGNIYTCAQVTVQSPTGGATRVVRISQLGEVAVGQSCP